MKTFKTEEYRGDVCNDSRGCVSQDGKPNPENRCGDSQDEPEFGLPTETIDGGQTKNCPNPVQAVVLHLFLSDFDGLCAVVKKRQDTGILEESLRRPRIAAR